MFVSSLGCKRITLCVVCVFHVVGVIICMLLTCGISHCTYGLFEMSLSMSIGSLLPDVSWNPAHIILKSVKLVFVVVDVNGLCLWCRRLFV